MADIELIPRDYAALRLLRRRLRRLGVVVGLIVVLAALGRAALAWRLSSERPQVEAMKQAERAGAERRSRVLAMETRLGEAGAQTASLGALRQGAAWETVFRAVDRAYNPNVWFEGLSYSREVQVEVPAAAAAAASSTKAAPPMLRHGFEILGHATTHAAITEFMRALAAQPGVTGVRLAETGSRRQGNADIADFRMLGVIDAQRKAVP